MPSQTQGRLLRAVWVPLSDWVGLFLVAYWHVTGFKAKFGVLMASRYILRAYSATYTGRTRLYRPHSYAGGMGSRQEGRDWPFTYR
jgi:hypothetical protein